MINYYEVLEIERTATDKDIKIAYRKLAKKWHPDTTQFDKAYAANKFKEITNAYNVLSNFEARKIYDYELECELKKEFEYIRREKERQEAERRQREQKQRRKEQEEREKAWQEERRQQEKDKREAERRRQEQARQEAERHRQEVEQKNKLFIAIIVVLILIIGVLLIMQQEKDLKNQLALDKAEKDRISAVEMEKNNERKLVNKKKDNTSLKIQEEKEESKYYKTANILKKYGYNMNQNDIIGTSFGNNSEGFLAVVKTYKMSETNYNGIKIAVVDLQNQRTAMIDYRKDLLKNTDTYKNGKAYFTLEIENDVHDEDKSNRKWINNVHYMPIQVEYITKSNKELEPGMIKSCYQNMKNYNQYLQEQKNVDMVNLIITEMNALKRDMFR